MIKRSDGKYLAHKGGQKWTSNVKIAHVFDSTKDPRETLDKEKCFGETVTTEDW